MGGEKERGMETRKIMSSSLSDNSTKDDDEIILPGFRFHPTDEELIGFYLQRKVEKKSFSIELIKQVDIYKYDPWDLPRVSCAVGEKEWYFFCIRGRKYRNSIRPNRVTGSGFWKATGIDKPIYSSSPSTRHCIGLKKSLVYYRGSAGKGTKTDWMMHEFRLPPPTWIDINNNNNNQPSSRNFTPAAAQQAEVWTLCRILKRNSSYNKYSPTPGAAKQKRSPIATDSSSKTRSSSLESDVTDQYNVNNLGDYSIVRQTGDECKSIIDYPNVGEIRNDQLLSLGRHGCVDQQAQLTTMTMHPSFWSLNGDDEFFRDGNWDELRSVVELAIDHPSN